MKKNRENSDMFDYPELDELVQDEIEAVERRLSRLSGRKLKVVDSARMESHSTTAESFKRKSRPTNSLHDFQAVEREPSFEHLEKEEGVCEDKDSRVDGWGQEFGITANLEPDAALEEEEQRHVFEFAEWLRLRENKAHILAILNRLATESGPATPHSPSDEQEGLEEDTSDEQTD